MYVLALDTSTESCSIALGTKDCASLISSKYIVQKQQHAALILPMIDELLNEANIKLNQISFIAFGRGPGAFTGLRIAASVAQGLAFGINAQVVAISTLAAIAERARRKYGVNKVAVCIDARMNEIYSACFSLQNGQMQLSSKEQVQPPSHFKLEDCNAWFGAGSGWSSYADDLPKIAQQDGNLFAHAKDVLTLAQFALSHNEQISAEQALPIYLRNNVAKPKK